MDKEGYVYENLQTLKTRKFKIWYQTQCSARSLLSNFRLKAKQLASYYGLNEEKVA